ncbi:MAG TPA: SIS domain-containing protein [Candidatus Angelobacter sp.]|nr:SIS domain-containing protein [Candidatus Angelobacter sp.]
MESYFQQLARAISAIPFGAVGRITDALVGAFENGRTALFFGNGGSAAAASHVICDLNKAASSEQRRLKAISLTDNVPLMTAWANDAGYEHVFSEQLKTFVQPGDVAVAISCSGNSANVLLGIKAAREAGAITVGLTGFDGGNLKEACDICVIVPSYTIQIVEDIHCSILHALTIAVRERIHRKRETTLAAAKT